MTDVTSQRTLHRTADNGNVTIESVDAITGQRAMFEETDPEKQRRIGIEQVAEPLRFWWEPIKDAPWMTVKPETDDALGFALMLNIAPPEMDRAKALEMLDRFVKADSLAVCTDAIVQTFDRLAPSDHGIELPTIRYTLALANEAIRTERDNNAAYIGVGGTPGSILMAALPNDYNLPRLAPMAAHEAHHNVRLTYEPWNPETITVGQYLVIEGLAEAFSVEMFREDLLGPWTRMHSEETLQQYRAVFREALEQTGDPRPYMFGDWAAEQFHYEAKGLPNYIGYGMSYRVVKSFVEATGISATEATYMPWKEIAERSPWLWEE